MVSKAREDLPEPDRPVNTTSWSRGISTSTFLRLCSRAPRMAITRESFGGVVRIGAISRVLPGKGQRTVLSAPYTPERRKNNRRFPDVAPALRVFFPRLESKGRLVAGP